MTSEEDTTFTIDARNVEEEERLDRDIFVRKLHTPPEGPPLQRTTTGQKVVVAFAMTLLVALGIVALLPTHAVVPAMVVALLGGSFGLLWRVGTRRDQMPPPIARDMRDRFTLRMSQQELVVSGARCPPRVIALDRIDGFVGDDRIRVQVRDGTTVALPCALARAENEALAASLSEALARKRANAADYRGERIHVGAEEQEEAPEDESARARR